MIVYRRIGMPVNGYGQRLIMLDRLPVKFDEVLTVTIESTDSAYPQGVAVSEGVEVFGERVKRAVVWEYFSLPPDERPALRSKLPFAFEVKCRNKKGELLFYNMAEFRGRQEWWHGGACMQVEEVPGGRRYRCNDFELDEDFNDIIFTVTRQ